jgi:signal transduction histidine kinase
MVDKLCYNYSLNNIAKYSGAKYVEMVFEDVNDTKLFSIFDDGITIDLNTITEVKNGNKLNNIRERAKELNAVIMLSEKRVNKNFTMLQLVK